MSARLAHFSHGLPAESFETYEELMALDHPLPYVQGSLALNFDGRTREPKLTFEEHGVSFDYQQTGSEDLPEPKEWVGAVAQSLLEVLAGTRPAAQLVRHLSPSVHADVAARGAVAARRRFARRGTRVPTRPCFVRTVMVCEPASGVAECTVIVQEGGRTRAIALRMLGLDRRWRIVELAIG